jgi:hypothetical protein
MKIKELIKELKRFDKESEVDFINCYNEKCPCIKEGGLCDSKNCTYTAFDISHINKIEKDEGEEHDRVSIYIEAFDGWDYDSDGKLILEN